MSYSIDYRKKVLGVKAEEKISIAEAAKRFAIGKATIVRWMQSIEMKRRQKSTSTVNMEALKKDIEEYPDAYQYERGERLGCTRGGIYHALKRLRVTYKKNTQASESGSRKTICILPRD